MNVGICDCHCDQPRLTGTQAFRTVEQFQRLAGIQRIYFDPSCGGQGDGRMRIEFQRAVGTFSGARDAMARASLPAVNQN